MMYSGLSSFLLTAAAIASAAAQLHVLGDLPRAHIEHAAEEAGEAEHVVDLVREVAAAGRHDGDVRARQLGPDLRVGVGHRHHDRVAVHLLHVVDGDHVRAGEAEEEVGALHRVARRSR